MSGRGQSEKSWELKVLEFLLRQRESEVFRREATCWKNSIQLSNSTPRHWLTREGCVHTKTRRQMFGTWLCMIARVDPIQLSISWWTDKPNVVSPCIGVFFSVTKEQSIDIGYHTDRPQGHHAEWKKPATREHTLYESIYLKMPIIGNTTKSKSVVTWGCGEGTRAGNGHEVSLCGDANVLKLACGDGYTALQIYIKKNPTKLYALNRWTSECEIIY